MRSFLLFLLALGLLLSQEGVARQFPNTGRMKDRLDKAKDKREKVQDAGNNNPLAREARKKLATARENFDATSFNYALSLQDHAGLYESEEQGRKLGKSLLALNDQLDQNIETPAQQVSNLNEMGETQ